MDLGNAKELQQQVFKQMYPELSGKTLGLRSQALPVKTTPKDQLSVGFSRKGLHDYHLELRLRQKRGLAYQVAHSVKARAETEVNIALIESLDVPSNSDLIDQAARTADSALFKYQKRPLHLGLSIGHSSGGVGTLGAFVETNTGQDAILSCCHVLALTGRAIRNDKIYQPGRQDVNLQTLCDEHEIAALGNYTSFSKSGSNYLDGAYAILKSDQEFDGNIIPHGCGDLHGRRIASVGRYDELGPEQLVAKIGRTSGCTKGVVSSYGMNDVVIDMQDTGNVRFDNLLEIRWPSPDSPFAHGGDLGSLVFTVDKLIAVGLHFAGGVLSIDGKRVGVSYACSLGYLLEIFGLKFIS
jgi:hypothetical protein